MSGDIYKIEEVVTNYISNAINHCTRGGTITVSYSMYSDRVRVSVFNTGEPIPDKDIEIYGISSIRWTRPEQGNMAEAA